MQLRWGRIAAAVAGAVALSSCGQGEEKQAAAPEAAPAAAPTQSTVNVLPGQLGADLIRSDQRKTATFTAPNEIFAHAPTTMTAVLAEPVRLTGVAGMRAGAEGQPPVGDGVEFVISKVGADGASQVLFTTKIAPNGAPVPFDVQAEKGATLQLETKPQGNTDADWSYWGQLQGQQP